MALSDAELVALVEGEFESSMGAEGGDISTERAKAWEFYMSQPIGNEIEGQSEVVTSDVSDVVDGLMPSMLRLFTTAENLVGFDATGLEDEPAAEQESDYVNYVFFKRNPSFLILYTWFFDAFVQKNGIVKAWWDETEIITQESYQGLSGEELFDLLDDDELEVIERDERIDETADATGIIETEVHDVTFRRTSKRGQVRVDNVPPEEYRISSDARNLDPSEARFVGQEGEKTRSILLDMGFDADIVDNLPSEPNSNSDQEGRARYDKTDEQRESTGDRSQDEIILREAYIKVDIEETGHGELMQIFTAGGKILSKEPADRQPFHVISPQPLPHKHFGRATAEKVMDIQEINSTLLRQVLMNLYHTNNPSHAVWEQGMGEHTLSDLMSTEVGGIKRFRRPVGESWQPITIPFTAGNTFPMLEFFDKAKRDRTGVSSDSEGLSPEALKNIQTTVLAQATDIARMKVEAVARIFAETGIKSLFLHIHELVMKFQQKADIVKLRNKWVPVNPQEWRTRKDMTVNIGLGIGTREQNLLHLNAIWEKQKEGLVAGITKPKDFFNTASEIVKNANLKQPEMFFTDPGNAEMPQQSDEQIQLAQQQLQLQAKQQQLDGQKQQIDQAKLMLQHQREMDKLSVQQQANEDRFTVDMEKIRNVITELELKFDQDVPGARV